MTAELKTTLPLSTGLFTIAKFSAWSGLGKTKIYDLIKRGDLHRSKCGRRTLISAEEALRWRASLTQFRRDHDHHPASVHGSSHNERLSG